MIMSNPCKEKQLHLETRIDTAEKDIKQLRLEHQQAQTEIHNTVKEILSVTSENTKLIAENTSSIHALVEETRGIAKLWRDLQGVYSFGKVIQDVVKWVAIIGGIASITYSNYDSITKFIGL